MQISSNQDILKNTCFGFLRWIRQCHRSNKKTSMVRSSMCFETVEQRNLLTLVHLDFASLLFPQAVPNETSYSEVSSLQSPASQAATTNQDAAFDNPVGDTVTIPQDVEDRAQRRISGIRKTSTVFSIQFVTKCIDPNNHWGPSSARSIQFARVQARHVSISPPPPQRTGLDVFSVEMSSVNVSTINQETLDFLVDRRGTSSIQDALFPGIDFAGYDIGQAEIVGTLDVVELRNTEPEWAVDANGDRTLVWASGSLNFRHVHVAHIDLIDIDQIHPPENPAAKQTTEMPSSQLGSANMSQVETPRFEAVDAFFSSTNRITIPLVEVTSPSSPERSDWGHTEFRSGMLDAEASTNFAHEEGAAGKEFDSLLPPSPTAAAEGHWPHQPLQRHEFTVAKTNPWRTFPLNPQRIELPLMSGNVPLDIFALQDSTSPKTQAIPGSLEDPNLPATITLGQQRGPLLSSDASVTNALDSATHSPAADQNLLSDSTISPDTAVSRVSVPTSTKAYRTVHEVLSSARETTRELLGSVDSHMAILQATGNSQFEPDWTIDETRIGNDGPRIAPTTSDDEFVDIGLLPEPDYRDARAATNAVSSSKFAPAYVGGSYASIRSMEVTGAPTHWRTQEVQPGAMSQGKSTNSDNPATDAVKDLTNDNAEPTIVDENDDRLTEANQTPARHWGSVAILAASGLAIYSSRDTRSKTSPTDVRRGDRPMLDTNDRP